MKGEVLLKCLCPFGRRIQDLTLQKTVILIEVRCLEVRGINFDPLKSEFTWNGSKQNNFLPHRKYTVVRIQGILSRVRPT
jgi:hypothetical protein